MCYLFLFLFSFTALARPGKVIHVFVALCDNKNQGIVPVPEKIGNGQDPANNLYWGARFGVKNYFARHTDWTLVDKIKKPSAVVLERCIFKHKTNGAIMVADAYDGKAIKTAITDFLKASSGNFNSYVVTDNETVQVGGKADLICYVGHNGLMDFSLELPLKKKDDTQRETAVLACASFQYFSDLLTQVSTPILLTTNLMCPEAYVLGALIEGWEKKESKDEIRARVAREYNKYQKCGYKGAYKLFRTSV